MGYRHLGRLLGGLRPDHFDHVTLFGSHHLQAVHRHSLHSFEGGQLLNLELQISFLGLQLLDLLSLGKNGILNANHVRRLA